MFSCKNGECIDSLSICDGHADCSDKSDETQSLCAPMFKTYGKKLFKIFIKIYLKFKSVYKYICSYFIFIIYTSI